MSKEFLFFNYLLEMYATYKGKATNEILALWDKKNITKDIFDSYFIYHQESIENAYKDIDSLLLTGKHLY